MSRDPYASLKQGLVGAWIPSVSGSGLLLPDLSGRGNNGSLVNMDASDWVSSGTGRALDFDGVNDYVNVSPSAIHDFSGTNPYTLSAWFLNRVSSGTQTILNRGQVGSAARDFILYTNPSGSSFRVEFQNSQGSIFPTIVSSDLSLNAYYHVCATKDLSGSAALWINGIRHSTGTLRTDVPLNNSRSVVIGATFDATVNYYSNQIIDDIRIYNRILTESEIRLLASKRGIGLQPSPTRFIAKEKKTGLRRLLLTGQT